MKKRVVDLSLQELAAMGANAALRAANEARDAGMVVTGTVDFTQDDQVAAVLAERHPSGAVTLLGGTLDDGSGRQIPDAAKTRSRQKPVD